MSKLIRDRAFVKGIAWRDIPVGLLNGTLCLRTHDTVVYPKGAKYVRDDAPHLLATRCVSLIETATVGQDLPVPFVISIEGQTRSSMESVSVNVETQLHTLESKYCLDWWFGEPGSNRKIGLLAFRPLGLTELVLSPPGDSHTAA